MATSGDTQKIEQLLVQKYGYSTTLATEAAQRAGKALERRPEDHVATATKNPPASRPLPSIADEDDTPTLAAVPEHPSGGRSGTEHQAATIVALLREKYGYPAEWAMPAAWRAKAALQLVAKKEAEQTTDTKKPVQEKVIPKGPVLTPKVPTKASTKEPRSTAANPKATAGAKASTPKPTPKTSDSKPAGRILLIACPRCGFPLKLPESMFEQMKGRKARCPECEVKFLLPETLG